ncbi:MAG: dihydrolipoyl dehydrogenase family protein [Mycobacteriales bacterium]
MPVDTAAVRPPEGGPAWDLLVVGGGTAGIVAAKTAARFGATALLVEQDRLGGDCLWTGCVPSKSLLAAAGATAKARRGDKIGVEADQVRVDFAAVMGHVKAAIAAIEPDDSADALASAGVRTVRGTATFTGAATATIDGQPVRFRQAVVATGSQPLLPPIPGLTKVQPLTSDTVWSLSTLPRRLAVLGGGNIGCELGQAFARLGSEVDIVEAAPRLLIREDPDAAELVTEALRRDGVRVHVGATVTAIHRTDSGAGELEVADGDRIAFDRLLVAVGRRPRSRGLGLEQAGVGLDERGFITVDKHLRTGNRRIWAAGDVTGHPQFTHTAGMHGSLAATNAVLGLRRRVELAAMPRVTFTQPEVAAVGVGSTDAQRHPQLRVRTVSHEHVDRAVTEGQVDGFTRLVLDGKSRILGATVVGPHAGDTLAELVLAVRRGLRTRDLAGTIHAYPTYGYGPWDAAIGDVQESLGRGRTAGAIGGLVGARRRWLNLREHRP